MRLIEYAQTDRQEGAGSGEPATPVLSRFLGPHASALRKYVERMVGDNQRTTDVLAQLLAVCVRLDEPIKASRVLMFDLATRLALDAIRHSASSVCNASPANPSVAEREIERLVSEYARQSVKAQKAFIAAVTGLDPRQQRVITLRFCSGYSSMRTAAELGVSPAEVDRLLEAAVRCCRERMATLGIEAIEVG